MRSTVLALCFALVLPCFAQNASEKQQSEKRDRNVATGMRQMNSKDKQHAPKDKRANPSAGLLSSSDQSFLKALIEEDISEIELAKMALQKSSNPDVKNYAQTKILDADPQMRDGAAKIATDHGMQPPTRPNARQDVMHQKLSAKSGKIFDGAYMTYEADQQSADVKLVNAELASTTDPTVKSYVAKEKTPVVEAATSAKQISARLASQMSAYRQPDKGKEQHH